MLHVHSNLVGSACFEPAVDQRNVTQRLDHRIMRQGMFALASVCKNGIMLPIFGVAANVSLNAALRRVWSSPNQSQIPAAAAAFKELPSQMGHGLFGFCNDHYSAGVFVEPVNQARAFGRLTGQLTKMVQQGIDQGARMVADSWVYHHSRSLVDDHQVCIFIQYVQGQVFGLQLARKGRGWKRQGDDVAGLDAVVAFNGLFIGEQECGFGWSVPSGCSEIYRCEQWLGRGQPPSADVRKVFPVRPRPNFLPCLLRLHQQALY